MRQGHFLTTPEDVHQLPLLLPPHVIRSTHSLFTCLLPRGGGLPTTALALLPIVAGVCEVLQAHCGLRSMTQPVS